jgi:hypothetical protein
LPPTGELEIQVDKSGGDLEISWTPLAGATEYDVVRGDLDLLRSSGGNYSIATKECIGNDRTIAPVTHAENPNPGKGFWYLARGDNCGGKGTYDTTGPGQQGPRDAAVAASPLDCP